MTVTPLSILDLSPISAGSDVATALHNTIDLAQHAEQWGYKRYWLAEHHFVAVASSSPAMLIGQIAAATGHIRVGSAAVQIGHTTAIAVVESFGMLDALYPGRIDMGLGRSGQRREEAATSSPPERPQRAPNPWREVDGIVIPTPFDPTILMKSGRIRAQASALAQPCALPADFAEQIADIEAMLKGTYTINGHELHAVPGEHAQVTPWIFGSTRGQSAQVAGARGLPFVASYHITPGTALDAIAAYRKAFQPSARLTQPYVVVSADVVVADDNATARHLASSYGRWVYSIRSRQARFPTPIPTSVSP